MLFRSALIKKRLLAVVVCVRRRFLISASSSVFTDTFLTSAMASPPLCGWMREAHCAKPTTGSMAKAGKWGKADCIAVKLPNRNNQIENGARVMTIRVSSPGTV